MSPQYQVEVGDFTVESTSKTVVRAAVVSPQSRTLCLSNLDLLSGRFPVTFFFVYPKPTFAIYDAVLATLKTSLAQALEHYYPFAGRIFSNPDTGEPQIACNNHGVEIVEAHVGIPLSSFDYYDLSRSIGTKLALVNPDFPLHVQVTGFSCGGISISFNFDHALADAFAFGEFLVVWSEIARRQPISIVPNHQRLDLCPRSPPIYNPSLDRTFTTCKLEEIINMPANYILLKRLYHLHALDIDRLQELASSDGKKKTKTEAVSAYLWKMMASSGVKDPNCKMGWLVDGRSRMVEKHGDMKNFVGNVVSMTVGEASVEDLKQGSLAQVAETAHEAISEATNQEHFSDLIDWIERRKPGLMLARILLGRGEPALVISSIRRFPVGEIDFGFGPPLLGTCYSTIDRISFGYISLQTSAKGDGSMVAFAIIWPGLAEALESDPDHVFRPMTAAHMGIASN